MCILVVVSAICVFILLMILIEYLYDREEYISRVSFLSHDFSKKLFDNLLFIFYIIPFSFISS